MFGKLSHEKELPVPANEAWELYGTLELGKVIEKEFSDFIQKVEIVEGDGGCGTILNVIFAPGVPGLSSQKEKFIKVDNENRIKVAEVIEGGYLGLGFSMYRFILEVIEKEKESSIVKSSVEYELKEEASANVSLASIQPLANIAEIATAYFNKKKSHDETAH